MDTNTIINDINQGVEKIEDLNNTNPSPPNPCVPNKMDKDVKAMVLASRKARRIMVIAVLLYCGLMNAYIAYYCHSGASNNTMTTMVTCSFALCGTVLSAYFGFSSYQDRNFI